jgi:chromate transporter
VNSLRALIDVVVLFAELSVSAFGGITVALPQMEHEAVQVYHWMSAGQFAGTFALGQIVPGPGTTFVLAIGYKAAGPPGALAAVIAIYAPAAVLAYMVESRWDHLAAWPWHEAIQRGITPVTTGLLLAASYALLRATVSDVATAGIAAVATLLLLTRRANPMLVVLLGGVVGWAIYH